MTKDLDLFPDTNSYRDLHHVTGVVPVLASHDIGFVPPIVGPGVVPFVQNLNFNLSSPGISGVVSTRSPVVITLYCEVVMICNRSACGTITVYNIVK